MAFDAVSSVELIYLIQLSAISAPWSTCRMADLFAFQVVSERAKCHELTIWYKDLPVYSQECPVEEANE